MYSTKTAMTLSLNDIKNYVTDYDIYSYYLGKFQIGKLLHSPLRNDDRVPSFAIFPSRTGGLLFKDHGSGQSGNALTFVKLMLNKDDTTTLKRELLNILKKVNPTKLSKRTIQYSALPSMDIGIVRQPFTNIDLQYWAQFRITKDTLKFYNVFSIKYFLCNNIVRSIYKNENPMYAYKVDNKFKIYKPLASKYTKWRSNLSNYNVQGLDQLRQCKSKDLLIITKSMKDVMVLYEMGYNAISPSSETTFIPDDIYKKLRKEFGRIILLFDRDKTGVRRTRKLSREYGIPGILVNKKFKAKDISDAVKINGFEVIKNWLDNTLKST